MDIATNVVILLNKHTPPVLEAFCDIKKGFRNGYGEYVPKNVKKHKRVRRRLNIKNIEVNPLWIYYI